MSTNGPFSPEVNRIIGAVADHYGISRATMFAYAMTESSGDPNSGARRPPEAARGLYQQTGPNARDYGIFGQRLDPERSADAAARYLLDNARAFRDAMGREPTAADLYIMHQQGRRGGLILIRQAEQDPTASAADVLERAGVRRRNVSDNWNVGRTGIVDPTVDQFLSHVTRRFNGYAQDYYDRFPEAVTNVGRAAAGIRTREQAQRDLDAARNPTDLFGQFRRPIGETVPVPPPAGDRLPPTRTSREDVRYADGVYPNSLNGLSIGSQGAPVVPLGAAPFGPSPGQAAPPIPQSRFDLGGNPLAPNRLVRPSRGPVQLLSPSSRGPTDPGPPPSLVPSSWLGDRLRIGPLGDDAVRPSSNGLAPPDSGPPSRFENIPQNHQLHILPPDLDPARRSWSDPSGGAPRRAPFRRQANAPCAASLASRTRTETCGQR